jgi:predicted ATPase
VPIPTLALVCRETEEAVHAALWDAVQAGLVFRQENAYKFLHDRIQQAAYSLIPDEDRADVHLRIGREMLSRTPMDELGEHLFDIANQFNWSAARLIDRDEKARVAISISAPGEKPKRRLPMRRQTYSWPLAWRCSTRRFGPASAN